MCVPVVGGLIVGFMARYGSKAIRGHGIPEAMEQVLLNESRIPARVTFLKPLSAAIAIGTGGPFGAEGPIIATGGALGSLVGQLLTARRNARPCWRPARRRAWPHLRLAGGRGAAGGGAAAVRIAAPVPDPGRPGLRRGHGVRFSLHGIRPVFPMADLARPRARTGRLLAVGALVGAGLGGR